MFSEQFVPARVLGTWEFGAPTALCKYLASIGFGMFKVQRADFEYRMTDIGCGEGGFLWHFLNVSYGLLPWYWVCIQLSMMFIG